MDNQRKKSDYEITLCISVLLMILEYTVKRNYVLRERALMFERLEAFCRDDEGATLIEYAFVASLLAVAGYTALGALGNSVEGTYGAISNGVVNSISGRP